MQLIIAVTTETYHLLSEHTHIRENTCLFHEDMQDSPDHNELWPHTAQEQ